MRRPGAICDLFCFEGKIGGEDEARIRCKLGFVWVEAATSSRQQRSEYVYTGMEFFDIKERGV
jgi:hypothetical protein